MNAEAKKKNSTGAVDNEEFLRAKESAREAYAKFQEARDHLRSAAHTAGVDIKENANEFMEDKVDSINTRSHEIVGETEDYVRKNPVKSAGIAFLTGFIASKLFRL